MERVIEVLQIKEALQRLVEKERVHARLTSTSYRLIRYKRVLKELDGYAIGDTVTDLSAIKHVGASMVEEIKNELNSGVPSTLVKPKAVLPTLALPSHKSAIHRIRHNSECLRVPQLFSIAHVVLLVISGECVDHLDAIQGISYIRSKCVEHCVRYQGMYGCKLPCECTDKRIKGVLKSFKKHSLAEVMDTEVRVTPTGRASAELIREILSHVPHVHLQQPGMLLIDSREKKRKSDPFYFHSELSRIKVAAETRVLSIGDFLWMHTINGQEYYSGTLIERKTICDLLHSLRDGRYREQKERLGSLPGRKVYVIEGATADLPTNKTMLTAAFTLVQEGFLLFNPATTEETLSLIEQINRKVVQEEKTQAMPLEKLLAKSQKKRIEEYSPLERTAICLQAIKGVPYTTAALIAKQFGSLSRLIAQAQSNPPATLQQLAQIQVSQKRVLGEKKATDVLHFLGCLP